MNRMRKNKAAVLIIFLGLLLLMAGIWRGEFALVPVSYTHLDVYKRQISELVMIFSFLNLSVWIMRAFLTLALMAPVLSGATVVSITE